MNSISTSIYYYLILIGGIAISIYALWSLISLNNFKKNASITNGTIIDYRSKVNNDQAVFDKGTDYAPVFKFITETDKKEIMVQSTSYKSEKKYAIGSTVKVYYDNNNPKKAYIEESFPWRFLFILLTTGIIGFLIPLLLILKK
ncbi:DUF3592 domain-containing protein [Oceanihabitans sp. 2_MG-2023]|uniref:DUF3592 domain-containing protein n=1 Tax=Oceanihabitans sp. 2_MG-2023 TaxID=3062661 RepID=UPI0026E12552|nr:DUF3592 domain-containing protein [Oceanihabitans sp. 2_MG-2023]MDO6597313.1 DUF3592 domain-containing protein [Oceanihabitans sp. 2_MG-2023]